MTLLQDAYAQAKDILNRSEKLLICVNNRASFDTHLAAAALLKAMQGKGKSASICMNGDLILKHKQAFDDLGVDYEAEPQPLNYVIAIDHAGGDIEKVSYDDKDGKFYLYITPVKGTSTFDFKRVSFKEGGGQADALVVFGMRSLQWMESVYEQNKELFDTIPVININNLTGTQEFGTVKLVDTQSSIAEMVYELIRNDSFPSADETAGILLLGLLDHLQPLQRGDYKIASVDTLTSLVHTGADLKKAFALLYHSRSFENFTVVQRIMSNVKMDQDRELAWATVSAFDLSQCGVNRENFVLDGRIVFNICRDFKAAFVLYEIQEGEIVVEFESNDPDRLNAKDVLSPYKVSGNGARVFFTIRDKTLAELEQDLLTLISPKVGGEAGRSERPTPRRDKGENQEKGGNKKESAIVLGNEEDSSDANVGPQEPSETGRSGLVTPPPVNPRE